MQRQGVATYKLRTEVIFKETNEKGHKIQKSVANRVQSNCFLSKSRVARYFNGGLILVSLRPKLGLYLPLSNLSLADAVGTPHQALLGRRPQKKQRAGALSCVICRVLRGLQQASERPAKPGSGGLVAVTGLRAQPHRAWCLGRPPLGAGPWPRCPPGRCLHDARGLGDGQGREGALRAWCAETLARGGHRARALTRAGAASAMATVSSLGCDPPPTGRTTRGLRFSADRLGQAHAARR